MDGWVPLLFPLWDFLSWAIALGLIHSLMVIMQYLEKGQRKKMGLYNYTIMKAYATAIVKQKLSLESGTDVVLSAGEVKGRYIVTKCLSEG